MKIVDRATFLAMPAGTVYAKYAPCSFEELTIKEDTLAQFSEDAGHQDFLYQGITDSIGRHSGDRYDDDTLERAQATGDSVAMDFEGLGRDGLFDADQLFAVWEPNDVRALIARLQRTLTPEKCEHWVAGRDGARIAVPAFGCAFC